MGAIVEAAADGQTVRLPSACLQPIGADDVAAALAEVAVATADQRHGRVGGPEAIPLDELGRQYLKAKGELAAGDDRSARRLLRHEDQRSEPHTGKNPLVGPTRFGDWMSGAASRS